MTFSTHLKALLWREALLIRQSKLFAVLQLLASCVLLVGGSIALSTISLGSTPSQWLIPSSLFNYDISCYMYDAIYALPDTYVTNTNSILQYMNASGSNQVMSYPPAFPTDIFNAQMMINATDYATSGGANLSLPPPPPFFQHMAPTSEAEGTADVFLTTQSDMSVGAYLGACLPYFFSSSFDFAAVPALQPLTTMRQNGYGAALSTLPLFAALSSMAVVAAMLPAVAGLAVRLTDDKVSRLREHLKIMGMHNLAYYTALHAVSAARIVPVALGSAVAIAVVAPQLLTSSRAVAYFVCVLVGGVSIGLWIHPIGLSMRKPMLTTTVSCMAVLSSAAMVFGVFLPPYVPSYAQWPLLLFFGAPAGTMAALIGLVLQPVKGGGLPVSPMASLAAAVLSGLFWGAVGEYRHARNPGEYGVPQPAGYPLWALLRWLRSWRSSTLASKQKKKVLSPTTADEKAALLVTPAATCVEVAFGAGGSTGGGVPAGKAVEIRNLWKVFGQEAAVSGLDLDVHYGEILALLGHNGAGKSTTVSVLTGMLPATRSELCKVGGRDVALDIDGVREVIGVCPQVDILMPDLSATEHVRFFGALRGVDNRERGLELLRTLDLPLTEQKAGTFSGGMKRRLSLALALCTHSPVLFLDEPSSGLDPVHRRQVWDLLRRERAEGRGIILTTHFMEEAEVLGDRVAIMAKGRLRCCDTTAALKARFGVGDMLHLSSSGALDSEGASATETSPVTTMDIAAVTRIVRQHLPRATVEERVGGAAGGGGITVTVPHHHQHQHHRRHRHTAATGEGSQRGTEHHNHREGGEDAEMPAPAAGAAEHLDRLAAVLAAFEQNPALGVRHCSVAQTSIEDVFLRIADQTTTTATEEVHPQTVSVDQHNHSRRESGRRDIPQTKSSEAAGEDDASTIGPNPPIEKRARSSSIASTSVSMHDSSGCLNTDSMVKSNQQQPTLAQQGTANNDDLLSFVLADHVTTAADLLLLLPETTASSFSPPPSSSSPFVAACRTFGALWKLRLRLLLRGTYGLPLLLPLLIAGAALGSLTSLESPDYTYYYPPSPTGNGASSSSSSSNSMIRSGSTSGGRGGGGGVAAAAPPPGFSFVSPVVNNASFSGTIGFVVDTTRCDRSQAAVLADRMHRCLQAAVAPGNTVPPLEIVSQHDVLQGFYPIQEGALIPTAAVPAMVLLDALVIVPNRSDVSNFQIRLMSAGSDFSFNGPFSMLVPVCMQRAFSTMVTGLDASRSILPLRFGTLPAPPPQTAPPTGAPMSYTITYIREYATLPFAILCPLVGLTATSASLPMLADLLDRDVYAKLRLHGAAAPLFWLAISAADASVVLPALIVLLIAPYAMSIPEFSGAGIFFMCAFAIAGIFAFNNLIASVLVLSLPRHLPMAAYVGIFACTSFVLTAAFAAPHLLAPGGIFKEILGMLNIGAALTTTLTNIGADVSPVAAAAVAIGVIFSVLSIGALALRLGLEPVWTALWMRRTSTPSNVGSQKSTTKPPFMKNNCSNKIGRDREDGGDEDVRSEAEAITAWRRGPHPNPSMRVVAALVGAWRVFSRPPLQAVRGVSCGVRLGECFGLLGPNGAGKTTAVGLLTAQDGATDGEVCVGDRSGQVPVHRYAPSSDRLASQEALHAALPMGLCSQHDTLFTTMTAEQHLLFYLSLRAAASGPWRPALWTEYIHEVLRRVGLGDVIGTKKPAGVYSGGMKRKLQVAIAMYTGGRLCVLDEPSTGMDPGARRFLWAAIHSALSGGERSVLLTTHSMEEAENACTRLAIMQDGQLRCIGTPDHLRSRYGDGYTLTVGVPADHFVNTSNGGLAALHAAVVETVNAIHSNPINKPEALEAAAASVYHDDVDASPPPPLQPAEVLGGRVLVYKVGRFASLSRAYTALAALQRRFPSITTSLAQNTSLEQIFIAIVGQGGGDHQQ